MRSYIRFIDKHHYRRKYCYLIYLWFRGLQNASFENRQK